MGDDESRREDAWEMNNRNLMRLEAIVGLNTTISRLYELDFDNEFILPLEELQNRLFGEMEG